MRSLHIAAAAVMASLTLQACGGAAAAPTAPAPTQQAGPRGSAGPGARNAQEGPKAYEEVITDEARTLSQARLERLVEFEAMAGRGGGTYTMADLMSDLREGVWGELDDGAVRVDAYRRNLQRAFLNVVDERLHPSEEDLNGPATPFRPAMTPPWASDIRGVMRAELEDLDALAQRALERAGDDMTRVHLRDVRAEITRILDDRRR